ncbi:hypothetical protein ACFO25_10510 [Paenactinomyces guangxiensis]|uniref:Uncharacterized protein n=1 Tax=Paenactinomyces guangxiensis TaxID=1490290 RepID=A0A7W1WQG0_9BACL|nr:hypothetical protein [Paenactinomyces guangxiensis]MBA4494170.1 hypothetical protein [Paenactinomyces guangxiensis]MBH8591085.1 hypothetical protein [Paenactinomyces guangxiensis]
MVKLKKYRLLLQIGKMISLGSFLTRKEAERKREEEEPWYKRQAELHPALSYEIWIEESDLKRKDTICYKGFTYKVAEIGDVIVLRGVFKSAKIQVKDLLKVR